MKSFSRDELLKDKRNTARSKHKQSPSRGQCTLLSRSTLTKDVFFAWDRRTKELIGLLNLQRLPFTKHLNKGIFLTWEKWTMGLICLLNFMENRKGRHPIRLHKTRAPISAAPLFPIYQLQMASFPILIQHPHNRFRKNHHLCHPINQSIPPQLLPHPALSPTHNLRIRHIPHRYSHQVPKPPDLVTKLGGKVLHRRGSFFGVDALK